jgi:hypothetical protein
MAITQGVAGSGGGGGGGGAVSLAAGSVDVGAYIAGSIADGAIVTLGNLNDSAVGDANGSLNAHARQIAKLLGAGITLGAGAATIGSVGQSGAWSVGQSGAWTVTANAGSGTFPMQTAAASPGSVQLSDGAAFYVGAKTGQLPSALVGGRLDVNAGAIPGTVSANNSSVATLGGGAVFTGTGDDVSNFASIFVSVFADQASAAAGLSVQFSPDNTNWDHTRAIAVSASSGMILSVSPAAKFFRVVYTNGATPNTVFRLQTIYRAVEVTRSISVFTDVNGTLSTAAMGQRMFMDMLVQDATGNATNRIRSARDLAAAPSLGGTFPAFGNGIHDGSNWRAWAGDTTGRAKTQATGNGDTITATLTRPANTTAYAVGDEMTDTGGAILQFSGAAIGNGGTGAITSLQITNSQNAAVKATGELRLYDTTSTPATDNAAFDASDTVNDTCVAVIPFTTASDGLTGTGGNCVYAVNEIYKKYKCAGGDTKLYGRVILKTAYTSPNNSDTWKFKLGLEIDS